VFGVEKKSSKMEDDEWLDLDVRAKATIVTPQSHGYEDVTATYIHMAGDPRMYVKHQYNT